MTAKIPPNYLSDADRTDAEMQVAFEQLLVYNQELTGGSGEGAELTLAGDTVQFVNGANVFPLDTESDAATDNLSFIAPVNEDDLRDGAVIGLHPVDAGRLWTVKNNVAGSGKILTRSGRDITASDPKEIFWFKYLESADTWLQISPDLTAVVDQLLGSRSVAAVGILSNVITPDRAAIKVTASGAQDVQRIAYGSIPNANLFLVGYDAGTPTLKHNTGSGDGKLIHADSADIVLSAGKSVLYMKSGVTLVEVARFGFSPLPATVKGQLLASTATAWTVLNPPTKARQRLVYDADAATFMKWDVDPDSGEIVRAPSVDTAYTLTMDSESWNTLDCANAIITGTLPDCATSKGKRFYFYLSAAGAAKTATFSRAGSDTIGSGLATSFTLSTVGTMVALVSDGSSNWKIFIDTRSGGAGGGAKIASIVPKTYSEYTGGTVLGVMLTDGRLKVGGDNACLPRGSSNGSSRFGDVIFDESVAQIPAGITISKVSMSGAHMAVVLSNNWVYTGGSNNVGQLGHGDTTTRYFLKRVEYFVTNSIQIRDVVCSCTNAGGDDGTGFTFFIGQNEKVYAVGYNTRGRLGTGNTTNISTPAQVFDAAALSTTVAQVLPNMAYATFMRLGNGDMYSTGGNTFGELGLGDNTDRSSFTKITGIANVAKILTIGSSYSSYASSTFALTTGGSLYCWGNNADSQLGTGNTTAKNAPGSATITDITDFIVGRGAYTANVHARKTNGDLWSWGGGSDSGLFSGLTTDVNTPTKFFTGKVAKMFAWRGGYNFVAGNGAPIIIDTAGKWHTSTNTPAAVPFPLVANTAYTANAWFINKPKELCDGSDSVADLVPLCFGTNIMAAFVLTTNGTLYGCGVGVAKPPALGYISSGDPTSVYWNRMNHLMGAA